MDATTRAQYESRARIIKAVAHPTRLFIVDELAKNGERCVCELTGLIGADMSTVSRHLSLLSGAGIIESDKRGLQVYYRLRAPCIMNFLQCIPALISGESKNRRRTTCGA